jgi:undecaprenyl-diphosphatase
MIPASPHSPAIIQIGAILAEIIYFRSDIGCLASAWLRGLVNGKTREAPDYRFAWYVILGSMPIGIVGFEPKARSRGPCATCGSWWWRSWAGAR